MPPNTRINLQPSHSLPHTCYLNLTILWGKVQIRLTRQYQRLRLDAPHCSLKIAIIRLLRRAIRDLPRVRHAQHILRILAERPCLPKIHHEVLDVLEAQDCSVEFLAVEGLAEAPACVDAAEGLEADLAGRAGKW